MLMRFTLFFCFALFSSSLFAQIQTAFPYIDNFDLATTNWQTSGNLNTWKRGAPSMTQINSAYSGNNAWMTDTLFNYANNRLDALESPLFNFSTLSQAPYLRFKYNMKTESCCDYVKFQYTLDETNWNTVGTHNTGQNWHNDSTVDYWSGNSNGWNIASHILDAIPLTQNVRFRFLFFSDYSQRDEGFAIDDFEILQNYTDVGLGQLIQPISDACDYPSASPVSVEVENLGQTALNNINISYQLDSNTIVTETIAQIAADTSILYVFSQAVDLSANAEYELKVWLDSASDNYSINNTLTSTIINLDEINQFPYFTDFESGQEEWIEGGENSTWSFGQPMKSKIRGANSGQNAWVTGNMGFGLYNNNENSYVLSPCFNSTSLNNAELRMAVWWESESDYDGANIQYTLNDGINWQNIDNSNAINWYNNQQVDGLQFSGGTAGWSGNESFNEGSGGFLSSRINENLLAGNSSLRFRVNFGSDINTRDEGFAFDDFYFGEAISNDLALLASNKKRFDLCQGESDSLIVDILNIGSTAQSNFYINYNYANTSDSSLYSGTLSSGMQDEVFLALIQANDTGSFEINVYPNLLTDGFNQNDSLSIPLSIYADKAQPSSSNVQICDSARALLTASGDNLIKWYSDMSRINLVFVGDTFLTGSITTDTTFYISNTIGLIDTIGPEDNSIGNGSYTNVDSRTRIQVSNYTSILSAAIYANLSGTFDISIEDEQGNTLQSKTFTTSSGKNRIYPGFDLVPGNYIIRVHNFSGTSLYRNTSGAEYGTYSNAYLSILGNNFDPEFYYYLYDLRVSNSQPCEGESSVNVTRANISPIANYSFDREKNRFILNNRSQSAQTFTWLFENLSTGTLDSSNSIHPIVFLDTGTYKITLIARSNCGSDTLSRNFVIDEISAIELFKPKEKYELQLYPNPVRDQFSWATEASSNSFEVIVRDIFGREMYRENSNENRGTIITNYWKPGYYILQISAEDLNLRSKFIKIGQR